MTRQTWGYRLDRWHDQKGPLHLLRDNGSPACGASYRSTTGTIPPEFLQGAAKCRRCERIAAKRSA